MGSVEAGHAFVRLAGLGLDDLVPTPPRHPADGLTRPLPTPELIVWYRRAAELVAMIGAPGTAQVLASELYGDVTSRWAHVTVAELLVCLVEEQGSHAMTLSSFEGHMEECAEELGGAQARIDALTAQVEQRNTGGSP